MKNALTEGGLPLWLQLGALMLGLIGAVCLIWVDFKEKKDFRLPRGVAAICSVLVAIILMISAGLTSSQSNKEQRERDKTFRNLLNTVTGGDSFPRLTFSNLGGKDNMLHMRVYREGAFPLYDVSVKLLEEGWLEKLRAKAGTVTNEAALLDFSTVSIDVPSITDTSVGPYFLRIPATSERKVFDVFYSARNGQWRGKLRLLKQGYMWQFHCTTSLNGTNLYESKEPFDEVAYSASTNTLPK